MEKIASQQEKQNRLVLFYMHLHDMGLREEQISKASSALRFYFETNQHDSSFFDGLVAKRGRSAAARDNEEKKLHLKKQAGSQILPLGADIVRDLRKDLWTQTGWDSAKDLDSKGKWISIGLGYDSGSRVSNVTKRDGPLRPDHCLKAEDISFSVENKILGTTTIVKGGDELKLELPKPGAQVTHAALKFWTSKTASKSVSLDRSTEIPLLDDLVQWVRRSGVRSFDDICTRYWKGSRRTVTSKDVREAIKGVCVKHGLPSKRYSTKSMRSGFATNYHLCNGDPSERNEGGGWSLSSKVPTTHYDFAAPRGALSLGKNSEGLSVQSMRLMAAPHRF